MQLYYTPRSHFSRKVRILIAALDLDCDFIDVGNVAEISDQQFGPNPLMQVPTLVDGDQIIFESDHIAQYLVRKFEPKDRFNVLTTDVYLLNGRAVMNGIMSADVEIVLAQRAGLETTCCAQYDKVYSMIRHGLSWLENEANLFIDSLSYSNFHLTCLWDHLAFYQVVALEYQQLASCVKHSYRLPYIQSTAPV